jgi:ribosomal protein S6
MRKYEIMYVLRADLAEEARQEAVAYYADILTKNGATITKADEWGIRDLAYSIQKQTKGYYVVLEVEAPNEAINEYNRLARINENTLRYIAIRDERK